MNRELVLQRLHAFVARELLEGEDVGLDESTPLLELGLINSMSIVLLTGCIASEFSIEVPTHELAPDNLKDLRSITDFVMQLAKEDG